MALPGRPAGRRISRRASGNEIAHVFRMSLRLFQRGCNRRKGNKEADSELGERRTTNIFRSFSPSTCSSSFLSSLPFSSSFGSLSCCRCPSPAAAPASFCFCRFLCCSSWHFLRSLYSCFSAASSVLSPCHTLPYSVFLSRYLCSSIVVSLWLLPKKSVIL